MNKSKAVSETLRRAVLADGRSMRAIALAAGIEEASLGRFMRRERGLVTESVDGLCRALRLELVPAAGPRSKKDR